VHDSGLPPFAADFVDGGIWAQQEVLPSGETWVKIEGSALLRVTDPPNPSADPTVAETETGLLRLKWNAIGSPVGTMKPALEKNIPELLRVIPREDEPGSLALTYTFQTGDPRYKYLEHAVYVGKSRAVVVQAEEGPKVLGEIKVSYLAA